ncbi:MAG: hypothetical protein AB7G05_01155, partial [Hyphomonadaceae bacterium]
MALAPFAHRISLFFHRRRDGHRRWRFGLFAGRPRGGLQDRDNEKVEHEVLLITVQRAAAVHLVRNFLGYALLFFFFGAAHAHALLNPRAHDLAIAAANGVP